MATSHETLDGKNRARGIGDGLAFRRHAHQAPLVGKRHDARRNPVSVSVGDDGRFLAFHYSHD